MKNRNKFLLSLFAVVFFAFIAGFSLLHKGLPPTHDGEYHIIRFFLFDEALRDGNIYPRWASYLNNGFGVPLFNFVYPLPNYVASLFHLMGISFIDSFKISMFTATIIGGIFFYLWSKEFWGNLGGIVSSVFYTFSPYHFVDIYVRGSVGEVWALGLFPAFLWAYTEFVKSKRKKHLAYSSIFLALIIFSHNILALMFFVFVLAYMVFLISTQHEKKKLISDTVLIIFCGLALSAIFWIPALYEAKYVTGLQIFDVTSHFPQLYQLLIPSWGSGFSNAGLQNELSYQIGIANLLAIFLSLMVVFLQIKSGNRKFRHTIFFPLCFAFIFYLMLDISKPLWKTIPLMNYLQFPWRLLSLEILFASFLAGSIFSLGIRNRVIKLFIAIILISISFILGIGYMKPAYYMYRNDNYYISRSNFIEGTNSPGNVFNTVYLGAIPAKETEKTVFIKGTGKITLDTAKSNYYSFTMRSDNGSEIQANLAYFPGWEIYVNDKKESLKSTQKGRFTFIIPKGTNSVKIIFKDTPIRKISSCVSMVALGFIIILLMHDRFVTIKK
jgi:uncharacterized membrane protein